jgi:putative tryptophan/tyrosine transport system substrate-binding protein
MRRREFIRLLGGAAAAWPLAASAQQPERLRKVGVLVLGNAYDQSFGTELREGLRSSGYAEGQNIEYVLRSADGNTALLPKFAAELVALNVDVITAVFTPCSLAAQQATREIPIVTVSGDPVALGLVASLARPGGNITGMSLITAELLGKCVELFRDALPGIRTVAALGNASDPFSKPFFDEVRSVGKATGIETPEVMVNVPDEIDSVLASMKKDGAEAVIVQGSLATQHVASLMINHRLPAASFARSFVEVGGLMSYGANVSDVFRHSAVFVAKILQGRRPEDLPVERPTNFELVINLKTAKALELKIAESFLLRANQLIE